MAKPAVLESDPALNRYVWLGAVTDRTFKIFLDVLPGEEQLLVAKDKAFTDIAYRAVEAAKPTPGVDPDVFGRLRHFHCGILASRTRYFIGVLRAVDAPNNPGAIIKVAEVSTFPPAGESTEVVLALGSCQKRAHDSGGLAEIGAWREAVAASRPDAAFLMLHMGDLHYSNIRDTDTRGVRHEAAIRAVVTDLGARTLFTHAPVAYTWDDHDFGANNSDADSPSRRAALNAFHAMIPKPTPDTVYHAFTVANVRVIISDLRSEADKSQQMAMSQEQLRFLLDEFREWRKYDAIVWLSSRPWIEPAMPGSDRWGGFARQRRDISNFVAELGMDNLVVVSGDAHMLAADNGSHSCYAEPKYGTRGFPVLHSSPLSQYGTVKGGPYSEGVRVRHVVKTSQYGMLSIRPSGDGDTKTVEMEFNGYRVRSRFIAEPLTLLKKQPVLRFTMARPFLTENAHLDGEPDSVWRRLRLWLTGPVRRHTTWPPRFSQS